MCGIFGYVGKKREAVKTAIEGLKKLEYRGYDSSGIAGIRQGKIAFCKEMGKIAEMVTKLPNGFSLDIAISQTRWATHGRPSKENAHPHFDMGHTLAIVHNGIIENHSSLRDMLRKKGVVFTSDTDTEVIAHLISSCYKGDLLAAVQEVILVLQGSYAVALIHQEYPEQIVCFASDCPMAIGLGDEEAFVSSDPNAFAGLAKKALFLGKGEIAIVKAEKTEIYDSSMTEINKEVRELLIDAAEISRGDYSHYTLKEIFEQPLSMRAALSGRFIEEWGTAAFDTLTLNTGDLLSIERILILACGTSWHAGYIGSYMLEEMARIPTQVEISSEYRYKNPILPPRTLVIAISQSGETADTLAAVRELKAKGALVLSICNVQESSLARESDSALFLRAGPEIGVCSTKAFTSQVALLALLSLLLGRMRHLTKEQGQQFIFHLQRLPEQIQSVLDQAAFIESLAKKYSHYENFFFIGRRYMYPTALEGALKLKEISYINANGYPAGEMKHGPIALINEMCPTVAFCGDHFTIDKLLSNLMEIKARSGRIIAIAESGMEEVREIADEMIWIPSTIDALAPIPASIAGQLFSYYIALQRGTEIDQPRNPR